MRNLVVLEEIWQEGNMYTAYCPELDVASCGRDVEEARENLLEVIKIQLEETATLGTLKAFMEDAGMMWRLRNQLFSLTNRWLPLINVLFLLGFFSAEAFANRLANPSQDF